MEQKNYLKIVWILAFALFALVSCWATAESLHLLLFTWPIALCWVVSVGFFLIASLGSKMIVDSLNQNIYLDKRGMYLVGGIVLTIVFWLICSMPTNTHTFLYRTIINDVVNTDIATTRGYLGQIKNNTNNETQAKLKADKLKNDLDVLLGELEAEIKNEANPGFGPQSKEILRKLAALLGVDKIEPLTLKGVTKQDRSLLCDAYRTKIYILGENKAKNIKAQILMPNSDNLREVKSVDENLSLLSKYIADGTINLNDPKDVAGNEGVCDLLNRGYNVVKKNKEFVNFSSESDEKLYTSDTPVTKVKEVISVFDVWKNYLNGGYQGYGFLFWIIISVLVDLAAFVFFTLAFKKEDI